MKSCKCFITFLIFCDFILCFFLLIELFVSLPVPTTASSGTHIRYAAGWSIRYHRRFTLWAITTSRTWCSVPVLLGWLTITRRGAVLVKCLQWNSN